MTTNQISAQDLDNMIQEQEIKRDDLKAKIEQLSQDTAIAMAIGQSIKDIDDNRHRLSEELRHTQTLIENLNVQTIENKRQERLNRYVKHSAEYKTTLSRSHKLKTQIDQMQSELSKLKDELNEIYENQSGARQFLAASKKELIEKYNFTQSEIERGE